MFRVKNPYSSDESDEDSLSPPPTTKRNSYYSDEDVDIQRLRIKDLSTPCNVLVIGPKHSGKTTIIQNILMYLAESLKGKKLVNCIFSADPKQYKHLHLDENQWKIFETYNDYDINIKDCFVRIVEDWKDDSIYSLYEDREAINIISVDEYSYIPSEFNRRIDYVVLLGNIYNLRDVWFDLAGIVKDYDHFKRVYEECTHDYDFLVVDYFGSSKNWLDHIWWGYVKPVEVNVDVRERTRHRTRHRSDRRSERRSRSRSRKRSGDRKRSDRRSRSRSRKRSDRRSRSRSRKRSDRRSRSRSREKSSRRERTPPREDKRRHSPKTAYNRRVTTSTLHARDVDPEFLKKAKNDQPKNVEKVEVTQEHVGQATPQFIEDVKESSPSPQSVEKVENEKELSIAEPADLTTKITQTQPSTFEGLHNDYNPLDKQSETDAITSTEASTPSPTENVSTDVEKVVEDTEKAAETVENLVETVEKAEEEAKEFVTDVEQVAEDVEHTAKDVEQVVEKAVEDFVEREVLDEAPKEDTLHFKKEGSQLPEGQEEECIIL